MFEIDHALRVSKLVRRERYGALRYSDARNLFRRTLEVYRQRWSLPLYAWSIVPSRIELVIGVPDPRYDPKIELMDLFGYFTRRYNRRYRKDGSLLRTKFGLSRLAGTRAICDAIDEVHALPESMPLFAGHEPWSSLNVYDKGYPDRTVAPYLPALLLTSPPPMKEPLLRAS